MSRFNIRDADFKLFAVIWNQQQNMTTPDIHFKMIEWLEWSWIKKDRHLLLQAFRSSGKSSLIGLFAAWLLYRNPDLRLLVLAADFTLAKKMVRNVRRIIERHPLTKHLPPDKPDQWASDRFTIRRYTELRDPSMLAKGITSNITGSRADIIICDDVEVPNTCETAEKREQLRQRLGETSFVLVPDGTQLYIGTPHTYHTIYAEKARAELGEDQEFLIGFKRFSLPALDENNESVWPEKFSKIALDHMKRQAGPNKFASQMMLQPVNIAEGRLDPKLLRIYEDQIDYAKEIQTLFIGEKKMVASSAWWDPAFGSARGDHSVLAITYADDEGNIYLHHLAYIKVNTHDEKDEATQQCQTIAGLAKRFFLPSISVETNGIGAFLPSMLRNELTRARAPARVQDIHSSRPKDLRILEAFDAVLAARRLFVHKSVLQTPFINEMQEWRPGSSKGHDDGLDAVAGAIAQQPIRLKRLYGSGGHSWMQSAGSHKAKSDFKI